VVATHQSGIDYGPTVLTYYYALCDHDPRRARERLLSLNRDQWAEVVLSDLERAHPELRTLTQRLDMMRWGHAMIRPHTGFRHSPSANAALCGEAMLQESLYHGVRAAEEILTATGRELISFR